MSAVWWGKFGMVACFELSLSYFLCSAKAAGAVRGWLGPPGVGERTVGLMSPSRALVTSSSALSHFLVSVLKVKFELRLLFLLLHLLTR